MYKTVNEDTILCRFCGRDKVVYVLYEKQTI